MSAVTLDRIAAHCDELLRVASTPDYPSALNGVQVAHRGPVTRIAAAVDASQRTIEMAQAEGANLLLVHHGLFWGGLTPVTGVLYRRLQTLLRHDIAVYSAHLPLDAHPTLGNSALLARTLDLEVRGGFAAYQTIHCGVQGTADLETLALVERTTTWAATLGHQVVHSRIPDGHRTRRWAICSGAGASAHTLQEAYDAGIDTLIVGEGPHWSAVEAVERGLVIVYAGHYATETFGVRALAAHLSETFGIPWTFLHDATGL